MNRDSFAGWDRWFVWLVAALAAMDAFGQLVQGAFDGRLDRMIVWMMVVIAMLAGTILVENLKERVGG